VIELPEDAIAKDKLESLIGRRAAISHQYGIFSIRAIRGDVK